MLKYVVVDYHSCELGVYAGLWEPNFLWDNTEVKVEAIALRKAFKKLQTLTPSNNVTN